MHIKEEIRRIGQVKYACMPLNVLGQDGSSHDINAAMQPCCRVPASRFKIPASYALECIYIYNVYIYMHLNVCMHHCIKALHHQSTAKM
jgi:hypothetical protein